MTFSYNRPLILLADVSLHYVFYVCLLVFIFSVYNACAWRQRKLNLHPFQPADFNPIIERATYLNRDTWCDNCDLVCVHLSPPKLTMLLDTQRNFVGTQSVLRLWAAFGLPETQLHLMK